MEAISRKPFQGITNIVRFNWHFYVLAMGAILLLYGTTCLLSPSYHALVVVATLGLLASILLSLLVSFYVYDLSGLYKLDWLEITIPRHAGIVNIHAGFDETSVLLAEKYPQAQLSVFDFYDPEKHTEVSIKRARKVYAHYPGTVAVATNKIPLAAQSVDVVFCILSAHEIRDTDERVQFFHQLKDSLKPGGKIIVVEHLRDWANFLAYNVGFFHFHAKREWVRTFISAGLTIYHQQNITPFITAFTLQKNGSSS